MDIPGNGDQPIHLPRPRNLGITRQLAVVVVIVAAFVLIGGVAGTALFFGRLSESVVGTLVTGLLTATIGLVGALKATEAADSASKAHRTATLTASQTAALQQIMTAHCGDLCPLDSCPFKATQEVRQ